MFSPLLLATVLWVASSSLILQNRHLQESTQLGKGGARGHVQVCPLLTPCSANLKKAMFVARAWENLLWIVTFSLKFQTAGAFSLKFQIAHRLCLPEMTHLTSFPFLPSRSPWSNKYDPPLEDGAMPSARLRKLEVEANNAFDQYRDL